MSSSFILSDGLFLCVCVSLSVLFFISSSLFSWGFIFLFVCFHAVHVEDRIHECPAYSLNGFLMIFMFKT